MTDLIEKIDWCRSHLGECEEIAIAGRKLVAFDREFPRGKDILNRALAHVAA